MSEWSARVKAVFALTCVLLLFVLISFTLRAQVTVNIATVLATLISAATLYLMIAAEPSEDKVNAAMVDLAHVLQDSWLSRMQLLLGRDPELQAASRAVPARVRFSRRADLELVSRAILDRDGTWDSIYEKLYKQIPAGRLVIVGEPGSGKTLLAIALVLQILRARAANDPAADRLPVPISVAGWDGSDDLDEWLVMRLREEWHLSQALAEILVRRHKILPVLDGLDEIGPRGADENSLTQQARVLRRLNTERGGQWEAGQVPAARVVVTCRTANYRSLRQEGGLIDAVVIAVQPMNQDVVREYLEERFDPQATITTTDGEQWLDFARRVGENPAASVLESCLTSPWYLSLAISACRSGVPLAWLESFSEIDDLRRQLTDSAIVAAVRLHPRGERSQDSVARTGERAGGRPAPTYDAEQVRAWLVTIARHLDWQSCHGLSSTSIDLKEIWKLATADGRRPRLIHTILAVFGGVLAGLLGGELADGVAGVVITSLTVCLGIAFGLWAGLRRDPRPSRLTMPSPREARGRIVIALAILFGVLGGIAGSIDGQSAVIGVSEGVSGALATLILAGLGDTRVKVIQPADALRTDLAFGLALAVVYTTVGGLPGGLTGGLLTHLHLTRVLTRPGSIGLAVLVGAVAGITLGSRCWLRYVIGIATEASHGRVPVRFARFMDWAYGASLLRIAGINYQFRHDNLRVLLAPPPAPSGTSPGSGD
jgi:NACHT domain